VISASPKSPTEKESTVKLKPLNDRVIVSPLAADTKTAGGILLPDTAKEKPNKGKVIAAGPGKTLADGKRVALAVKKGDVVYYGKYSGTEVKFGGEEFKILREEDILGIDE
jgi:chaperonin GroES